MAKYLENENATKSCFFHLTAALGKFFTMDNQRKKRIGVAYVK